MQYLISHGQPEKGMKNLTKLRKLPADHDYLLTEFHEIDAQARFEQEAHKGHGLLAVLQDIFTSRSNFQRFFLAVMLFLFHKFTGTDSLNYYAPRIFELIGVNGSSNSLLTTVRKYSNLLQRDPLLITIGCLWHRQARHDHFLRCILGR